VKLLQVRDIANQLFLIKLLLLITARISSALFFQHEGRSLFFKKIATDWSLLFSPLVSVCINN